MTEIGESLVGAYLRYIRECDLVLYNERTDNQGEIDVIGMKGGATPEVWLCEVATHIVNLGYGKSFGDMKKKISDKLDRASEFAARIFPEHVAHVEFWAPAVSVGQVTQWMDEHSAGRIERGFDVRFVVNGTYTSRVQDLIQVAASTTKAPSEPAFRLLQILTHVKGDLLLS